MDYQPTQEQLKQKLAELKQDLVDARKFGGQAEVEQVLEKIKLVLDLLK